MPTLGNRSGVHLYLNHTPDLSLGCSVPEMIQANGNHWRKIFSLYAKVLCKEGRWQTYRDQQLLHEHALIFDASIVSEPAQFIWVPGLENAKRLGLNPMEAETILDDAKWAQNVRWKNGVLMTPYLDYRQFPNRLVDALRCWLSEQGYLDRNAP
jgi:hypothetical protein